MNQLIGNIIIGVWLLCWGSLAVIAYKHGLTPWDAARDLIDRIL